MIHDMPYNGVAEVYEAAEYKADQPPFATVPLPYYLTTPEQVELVTHIYDLYKGQTVEKWKSVKWKLGFRKQKPRNCVSLVMSWVRLFTNIDIDVATPDELYSVLVRAAVQEMGVV
jgi:hypothetical protein